MTRSAISTSRAPAAIGTYSQAVRAGDSIYLSGQIPLDPASGAVVEGGISEHVRQVFENLKALAAEAGASLDDVVKLNVYLTSMENFPVVNEIMATYFSKPYPARAAVGVAELPKGVAVEMDAVIYRPTSR